MNNNAPHYTELPIAQLEENKGQIAGLPANPRKVSKEALEKLKKSIQEYPEMMGLRELLVYPHEEKYIVIGGNTRLKACKSLGIESVPCKIIPKDTPPERLQAYIIKDNVSTGDWDRILLLDGWNEAQLTEWDVEIPDLGFGAWNLPDRLLLVNLKEANTLRKQNDFRYVGIYTARKTSKKSATTTTLKEIKSDPKMVPHFAQKVAELAQTILGNALDGGDWAIVTAPKRRTKVNNFADLVCTQVAKLLSIPYYEDAITTADRDRVRPHFTLEKDPAEHNLIVFDDVVTTGITLEAVNDVLRPKHATLNIIGILNR